MAEHEKKADVFDASEEDNTVFEDTESSDESSDENSARTDSGAKITRRFGGFEIPPSQGGKTEFQIHISNFWKSQLSRQISAFLDRFFHAFSQFLDQNQDFVEMLRDFNKLFDNPNQGGFTVIAKRGLTVIAFYKHFKFLIDDREFLLKAEMSDSNFMKQAAFSESLNTLQTLLYEYLAENRDAVHAFPETVEDIQNQIMQFNLTDE